MIKIEIHDQFVIIESLLSSNNPENQDRRINLANYLYRQFQAEIMSEMNVARRQLHEHLVKCEAVNRKKAVKK